MGEPYSGEEYLEYWKKRVNITSDGTKTGDEDNLDYFLDLLDIQHEDKVLDLGCSFGRMCRTLKRRSNWIFGSDIDMVVVEEAAKEPYIAAIQGNAEKTPFSGGFFKAIVAWGVFDMVEQQEALIETNRILKNGGRLLFTGKNSEYFVDDNAAFIAERNARLKEFPNHFTHVASLIENICIFGFKVKSAFAFLKRGDFGNRMFIDLLKENPDSYYEYLLILEKITAPNELSESFEVCSEQSNTAKRMAIDQGFTEIFEYFKVHADGETN